MTQKYIPKFFWIINILIPVSLEILITIIVFGLYISLVILPLWIAFQLPLPSFISWIPLQLGQKLGSVFLLISIYFSFAWLDAIRRYFKYGVAIPKSLILWHKEFPGYIKNLPKVLGWKKTVALLFLMTVMIILLSKFLYDPEVNFDKLTWIVDSLKKNEEQLLSIQQSNEQFKQLINNQASIDVLEQETNMVVNNINHTLRSLNLDVSRDDKENKISTTEAQLSEIIYKVKTQMTVLDNLKNNIKHNDGELKQLVTSNKNIESKIKPICVNDESEQNIECLNIRQKIQQNENLIIKNQADINKIKSNELLKLQKSYANLLKIRRQLAGTQDKINTAKGFDTKDLDKWLSYTKEELNELSKGISGYSVNTYKIGVSQVRQKYNESKSMILEINKSTNNLERQTQLFALINEANSNKSKLDIIEEDSKQIIPSLNELQNKMDSEFEILRSVQSRLKSYSHQTRLHLRNLKKLSVIKSQSQYNVSIINIKKIIEDLNERTNNLLKDYQIMLSEISNQKDNLSTELGQLTASFSELKNKNKRILNKAIRTRIGIMATIGTLIVVVLFIVWTVVKNVLEKRQLDEKAKLGNDLNSFIKSFTDSTKTLNIRLYAVQKLNSLKNPLTEENINHLKSFIRQQEKSQSSNDREVAARLRKVVESLEIRASEKRRL